MKNNQNYWFQKKINNNDIYNTISSHHAISLWFPSQYGPASGSLFLQRQIDEFVWFLAINFNGLNFVPMHYVLSQNGWVVVSPHVQYSYYFPGTSFILNTNESNTSWDIFCKCKVFPLPFFIITFLVSFQALFF